MNRRSFLSGSALGLAFAQTSPSSSSRGVANADPIAQTLSTGKIDMVHDGLSLSPVEYAGVLERLAGGVGKDLYGRGGVVVEVEKAMAAELGKESAIYIPSGTLANHLAVRRLARPDARRILIQRDSHLYCDEGDCAQTLSGLRLIPIAAGRADLRVTDIEAELAFNETSVVDTQIGVISIESPIRRHDQAIVDFEQLKAIYKLAQKKGIRVHLDGARLPVAEAFSGISQRDWASHCDTVFVSMYKLYNAASGAVIAGSREVIEGLSRERRMFGGSLRQFWPLAAVGLAYQPGFQARYAVAKRAAEDMYRALEADGRFEVQAVTRGTSARRLRLRSGEPMALRKRMRGLDFHLPRPSKSGWFLLKTNETLNRRATEDLIAAFLA